VLAVGLGALVRNPVGGIASFSACAGVLPGIVALLPSSTAGAVHPYLPLTPASPSPHEHVRRTTATHLAPWAGFAVLAGCAVIVVGAAAVGLLRRDA
jgi:ABC-2 type transport system permease protein